MSIYDELKSPLDSDETLKKILDIYVNGRVDNGTQPIKSGYDLYSMIIDYGSKKGNDYKEHANNFYRYIKLPNLNRLYKNICGLDCKAFDIQVERIKSEIGSQPISEDEKKERISNLNSSTLFPLSQFEILFNSFKSFSDIEKVYYEQGLEKIDEILFNIELYPSLKQKYMQELQQLGLTEKKFKTEKFYVTLEEG